MQPSPTAPGRPGPCLRAALSLAAVLGLASALPAACGSNPPPPPPPAGDGGPDGGGIPCAAFLGGLTTWGDGGVPLDDAGFGCVALLYTDAAGTRTSLSLTPLGALPDGVTGFSAIVVLDGGQPPQQDAGGDAGPLTLGNPLLLQASASATLKNGQAFSLQKTPAATSGALSLQLTEVGTAGAPQAGSAVIAGHGVVDATLPYLFGPRPDGGPIDSGTVVLLHAEF